MHIVFLPQLHASYFGRVTQSFICKRTSVVFKQVVSRCMLWMFLFLPRKLSHWQCWCVKCKLCVNLCLVQAQNLPVSWPVLYAMTWAVGTDTDLGFVHSTMATPLSLDCGVVQLLLFKIVLWQNICLVCGSFLFPIRERGRFKSTSLSLERRCLPT